MKRLDTLINQARNNINTAHVDGALEDGPDVIVDDTNHFPPNPPSAFSADQPEPAAFSADQLEPATLDGAANSVVQSETATQHGAAPVIVQSQPPALPDADVANLADQSEPVIPPLEALARSELEVFPGPADQTLEPKHTGTKPKTDSLPPGLNLTKSQIKRQKNRDRKRKQRAALDNSKDKSSQQLLSWIKSSKSKDKVDLDDSESDESNTNDSIDVEKDSFDKKILEQSSKSFYEDNPFQIQDTYKSIFAARLSLTPLASCPSPSTGLPFSTPKRNRSPSPELLGIKSLKKQ